MIIITGLARFARDRLAEAVRLGIEHSARSRGEPGCTAHHCHIDAEDDQRIVFIELWEDMAAVQAHFAVPASGEFVRKLTAMAEAAPDMQIYDASELPRP